MKAKDLNYITLIYCGMTYDHGTYLGNPVYKLHFVDEQFTYFEFFSNDGYHAEHFLKPIKNGELITVGWKRYGRTWKKIAYTFEHAKMESTKNEK